MQHSSALLGARIFSFMRVRWSFSRVPPASSLYYGMGFRGASYWTKTLRRSQDQPYLVSAKSMRFDSPLIDRATFRLIVT